MRNLSLVITPDVFLSIIFLKHHIFLLQRKQIKSIAHLQHAAISKALLEFLLVIYGFITEQQLDTLNCEDLTCLFAAHGAFMDEATLKEARSKNSTIMVANP